MMLNGSMSSDDYDPVPATAKRNDDAKLMEGQERTIREDEEKQ